MSEIFPFPVVRVFVSLIGFALDCRIACACFVPLLVSPYTAPVMDARPTNKPTIITRDKILDLVPSSNKTIQEKEIQTTACSSRQKHALVTWCMRQTLLELGNAPDTIMSHTTSNHWEWSTSPSRVSTELTVPNSLRSTSEVRPPFSEKHDE
eukprot:scaffold4947_cov160-Amphora_coffeaeformis.AAC.4